MKEFENIFNGSESGYSQIIAQALLLIPEFRYRFFNLIKNRMNINDFSFSISSSDLIIQTEYFLKTNGKRIDIYFEGDNFIILIENKLTARYTDNDNQLYNYLSHLSASQTDKAKFLILLCPQNYSLPSGFMKSGEDNFCKISYSELLGILSDINLEGLANPYLKYLKDYLGEIEMEPFTGFNENIVNYHLSNAIRFKNNEDCFIKELDKALRSILYYDNGEAVFPNIIIEGINERRGLYKENAIGIYARIVRIKGIDTISIWLTFRFTEKELNFEMYLFCQSKEKAEELKGKLKNTTSWNNEIYFPSLQILQDINNNDWASIKEKIQGDIRNNISKIKNAFES